VRIGTKTSLKTEFFVFFEIPVSSLRSNKAHTELRLLSQSVYQSLCSDFRHLWVLERLHLLQYISPYLQETMPQSRHNTSIFSELTFIPSSSHAAENRSNACWRPCCENPHMQHQFARTKQTVHPAVCNSDTLVCDCLSNSYRPGRFKFFGRDHISYCTAVRGPDILRNVFFRDVLHSTKSTHFP